MISPNSGARSDDALIGYSGYVGSTLLRQTSFAARYRSTNIADIDGRSFDRIICAAAPAQKWLANRNAEADLASINLLIAHLRGVKCRTFVLVSTVDVFSSPHGVDEYTEVEERGLHPYGRHRRMLERFVAERFPKSLIVRLPGLVGPGLRKNIIFDFLNSNNLSAVDSRHIFQFYPMVNLSSDIEISLKARLSLLHLAAEPISVADVAKKGFGLDFSQTLAGGPVKYDMRSRFTEAFGGGGDYQYSRKESILAIRAYAQSERKCDVDQS